MSNQERPTHTMPTVRFDPACVTDTVRADLRENIEALNEFPAADVANVYEIALRAIYAGGDLFLLSRELTSLGVTKRRASEIARHLDFSAKALMEAEQCERMGIEFAIWMYSGAPCGDGNQDAAHKAANGKRYPVSDGMRINDRYTLPGRDMGCRCSARPLVPGFED